MSRIRRLAPFFILGPVTGPLVAGIVLNLRGRRYVLAGLYAAALAEFSFLLPWLTVKLGLQLAF